MPNRIDQQLQIQQEIAQALVTSPIERNQAVRGLLKDATAQSGLSASHQLGIGQRIDDQRLVIVAAEVASASGPSASTTID